MNEWTFDDTEVDESPDFQEVKAARLPPDFNQPIRDLGEVLREMREQEKAARSRIARKRRAAANP